MATRTSQSTDEIDKLIRQFHKGVEKAVATMGTAMEEGERTEAFVQQTTGRLSEIAKSVDVIDGIVGQIASTTEEQTAVTDAIQQHMESIRSIAESLAGRIWVESENGVETMSLIQQHDSLVNRVPTVIMVTAYGQDAARQVIFRGNQRNFKRDFLVAQVDSVPEAMIPSGTYAQEGC